MKKGVVFILVCIVLFSSVVYGKTPVDADTDIGYIIKAYDLYGREIIKIIRFLESNGFESEAINIRRFLDAGKLRLKNIDGIGENDEQGGPVFVDPGVFPGVGRGGFDVENPVHIGWMMELASTLIHEKFHSENHGIFDRIAGNGIGATGLGNGMELEAWAVQMTFIDEVIDRMLSKALVPGTSVEMKIFYLNIARNLLSYKSTKASDFTDNDYGPIGQKSIWNRKTLRYLMGLVEGEIAELENITAQNGSKTVPSPKNVNTIGLIIDDHAKFENGVKGNIRVAKQGHDNRINKATQDYATQMLTIPSHVMGMTLGGHMGVEVKLLLDLGDDDISTDQVGFLIEHRGFNKDLIISRRLDLSKTDYYLEISQSVLSEIYVDNKFFPRSQEYFKAGKFKLIKTKADARYLLKLLDQYNENIDKVPSTMMGIIKNEKVNFIVNDATVGVEFKNGRIVNKQENAITGPTLQISISSNTLTKILRSKDILPEITSAINNNGIEIKPLKVTSGLKSSILKVGSWIYEYKDRKMYAIKPGSSRAISFDGVDAVLLRNKNGVRYVVKSSVPDSRVVNNVGRSLGYSNKFAQTNIDNVPRRYSNNAGIYEKSRLDYRNQWNSRTPPLLVNSKQPTWYAKQATQATQATQARQSGQATQARQYNPLTAINTGYTSSYGTGGFSGGGMGIRVG